MSAISQSLRETILELQSLKSLRGSALGGGTNLAIRYGHRRSVDIDIFFSGIIAKTGFQAIENELKAFYGSKVFSTQYPCDIDDQFVFLRCFVIKNGETIKVEVIQNMMMLKEHEIIDNIIMVSELDIALFKMISASNRATEKDIYDLDYLTEKIPLNEIFLALGNKHKQFSNPKYHTIFDQDGEISPFNEPVRLLKFDDGSATFSSSRPTHSSNRVDIMKGHKNWMSARASWRAKVRRLFDSLGIEFPNIKSFN